MQHPISDADALSEVSCVCREGFKASGAVLETVRHEPQYCTVAVPHITVDVHTRHVHIWGIVESDNEFVALDVL